MKKFLITMFTISFLSACATDPYSGESKVSNTGWGTGIGALAGAAIGQIAGGSTEATLIGAGVGAAVGGGTGAYMDVQARKLRQELLGTGVQVSQEGNNIRLIMPGNITFATDSSIINSSFQPILTSVAKVIKEYNKTFVNVAGYTDNTGSAAYNNTLSLQRATSVSNFLKLQGVSANRLLVNGYGSQNPIASNSTAQGRAENRRVEITLVNQ
ncbi:MAG: OmpA family protein [Alphaproteobacteria bacterium]